MSYESQTLDYKFKGIYEKSKYYIAVYAYEEGNGPTVDVHFLYKKSKRNPEYVGFVVVDITLPSHHNILFKGDDFFSPEAKKTLTRFDIDPDELNLMGEDSMDKIDEYIKNTKNYLYNGSNKSAFEESLSFNNTVKHIFEKLNG